MEYFNQSRQSGRPVAVVAQHSSDKPTHVAYDLAPPGYGYDAIDSSESGSLLEYWRILRRYKKAVLSFSIIGGLLGIAVAIPQKPVYQHRLLLRHV